MSKENVIVRPRLNQNELGALVESINKTLKEISQSKEYNDRNLQYQFLLRLKRKMERNRKTNSFTYCSKKKITFVKTE